MTFDDQEVTVVATMKVLVAGTYENPERLAVDMVLDALRPLVHSKWNWEGRYAIVEVLEVAPSYSGAPGSRREPPDAQA